MSGERMLRLAPWEEVVGEFEKLEDKDTPRVRIKMVNFCTLEFEKNSDEARVLREELAGREGSLVRILRTDILEKPLMVRIVNEEEKNVNYKRNPKDMPAVRK